MAIETRMLKANDWIETLIKDRINNKEGEYVIGEDFRNFID